MPSLPGPVPMLLALILTAPIAMVVTADEPVVAVGCYLLGLILGCLRRRSRQP